MLWLGGGDLNYHRCRVGGILKVNTVIVALGCLVLLGGCRGLYEGFKMSKTEDCYRLAYPDQEQCLQQVNVSYDEYEKERGKTPLPQ